MIKLAESINDSLGQSLIDVERMHANALQSIDQKNAALASLVRTPAFPSITSSSKIAKATEQYQHFRGWAFVAIRAIAQRCAAQELFVGRLGIKQSNIRKAPSERIEPLSDHSLLHAVDNPNPLMTRWSLLFSTVASLKLTGRSAWWITQDVDRMSIWPIPSHWIEPVDYLRSAWRLRPFNSTDEIIVPAEEIAYFSFPDPSNPFSSSSPLQSQASAIATDEAIQTAQHRGFINGTHPGLAFRVGKLPGMLPGEGGDRPVLTEEQRQEVADAIHRLYTGVLRHGEPLIIDGLIEGVDRITSTIQEMDFLDSGKATKARVMQALGVNPIIVGEIEGANRAQAAAAEASFLDNTVNPILQLMGQTLTKWESARSRSENLMLWFDPARVDDAEQSLKEWEVGLRFGAVTLEEYRVRVLNLPAGDTRFDVALQPAAMLPAESSD